jgi:hypothetical protein
MKQEILNTIDNVEFLFRYGTPMTLRKQDVDNDTWGTHVRAIADAFKKAGYRVVRQYKNGVARIYCGNGRVTLSWNYNCIRPETFGTNKWGNAPHWRSDMNAFWKSQHGSTETKETLHSLTLRLEAHLDAHKNGALPSITKKKRVAEKLHLVKEYEQGAPAQTIVKYRVYMYSTKKDIHDPEGTIKFKADVWVTAGVPSKKTTRYSGRKVKTRWIPKCDVDLDTGELYKLMRDGGQTVREVITATNAHVVIEEIGSILSGTKETQ